MKSLPQKSAKKRKNRNTCTFDYLSDEAKEMLVDLLNAVEKATDPIALAAYEQHRNVTLPSRHWFGPVADMLHLTVDNVDVAVHVNSFGVVINAMSVRMVDVENQMISWCALTEHLQHTPEEIAMVIGESLVAALKFDLTIKHTNNTLTLREYLGFDMTSPYARTAVTSSPAVIIPSSIMYSEIKALEDL
jgi:hypothetical protein